ncbi:amidohydrolase family protein [Candidatus Sumerlaeota bacterium]|nr:amidohydrolase family protein [Candidatus Sumerlaeota bacterium]
MTGGHILRPGLALCPTGRIWRRPWLRIVEDEIAEIGEGDPPQNSNGASVKERPESILLPGFVNSHTHLALTPLAGCLEPTTDFWQWIADLVALRNTLSDEAKIEGLREGLSLSLAAGTTTLLDFATAFPPASPTVIGALRAVEIISFDPSECARCMAEWFALESRFAAPHSVYGTTPELLEMLADQVRRRGGVFTTHLSETEDENRLWQLGHSDGTDRHFEHFGVRRPWWQPPRCSPAQFLARLSALDDHSLLVHCNYLSDGDVELIAASGANVCVCPASHRFFGHAPHPLPRLLAAGVNVCLGTDSLASSPTLSMWEQMRIVAQDHPTLEWPLLLSLITTAGARALRLGDELGVLTPGAPADLILARADQGCESAARNPRSLFDGPLSIEEVFIAGESVHRA